MSKKIESLHKNQVLELVEPPQSQKIIGCKWIFKKKERILKLEATRFQTCLIAKSYSQSEGMDFNEIFFSIMKHISILVLLAIVALFDLELKQLDIKAAFLYSELEEQIYM